MTQKNSAGTGVIKEGKRLQETKTTRWYACPKDALIIGFVIAFSFWIDPIGKAYQILRWRDDLGILGMGSILAIMLVACTFLCVRHFWAWFVIGTMGTRASCETWRFLYNPSPNYTGIDYIDSAIINGLITLVIIAPAMAVLYRLKKKYVEKQSKE
ncbi:hypothetical protein [Pelosinus baikalensis]|uniref:Uncharacterized protein n=1 Tax=Pelosinus baikalensis TaxID=2892015 RepID=A0ABS8HYH0_9FIRM|nr:hypothetical protein [Pelosinus baikalensis]MCC5468214.1 hypothetical protein [Pelosinus baikalensis]